MLAWRPGSKCSTCYELIRSTQAPEALALLSSDEQDKASKYYFIRDAKLSLGSSLLKRLFAVKVFRTPWSEARFSRLGDPKHGKPCLEHSRRPGGIEAEDFNVSHQAGLVALAGCVNIKALFGVDIVCVNERNDSRIIASEGFNAYVDMHAEVFSEADLIAMKGPLSSSASTSTETVTQSGKDARLVRFYAYWCLKEAYIKLEGEALLAPWLKEVEFKNVRCPEPPSGVEKWGEKVDDIEVWREGVKVEDVRMVLQAFQDNYMIGTAIKSDIEEEYRKIDPTYTILDPEEDIYQFT